MSPLQIIGIIVQIASAILSRQLTGGALETEKEVESSWQLVQTVMAYHASVANLPYDPTALKPFVPIQPPAPAVAPQFP